MVVGTENNKENTPHVHKKHKCLVSCITAVLPLVRRVAVQSLPCKGLLTAALELFLWAFQIAI